VTWPEPFGLTLIEAMACGCPVVAMNNGSIPEIIQDGKTGFVVETVPQMMKAVKKIDRIVRAYCRKYSVNKFSAKRMAQSYEALYKKVLALNKVANLKELVHAKRQELFFGFGARNDQRT
jgi:glycosyltransferase involved in cell wall biosynthesis